MPAKNCQQKEALSKSFKNLVKTLGKRTQEIFMWKAGGMG